MEKFDAIISGVYDGNLSELDELIEEIRTSRGSERKMKIDELKEIMRGFPIIAKIAKDGGEGSGNFGHAGRQGLVGGSSSTNYETIYAEADNAGVYVKPKYENVSEKKLVHSINVIGRIGKEFGVPNGFLSIDELKGKEGHEKGSYRMGGVISIDNDTEDSTLAHEVGHGLVDVIANKYISDENKLVEDWNNQQDWGKQSTARTIMMRAGRKLGAKDTESLIKLSVGVGRGAGYSGKSPAEAVASCVEDYVTNGENAKELSVLVCKQIMSLMPRKDGCVGKDGGEGSGNWGHTSETRKGVGRGGSDPKNIGGVSIGDVDKTSISKEMKPRNEYDLDLEEDDEDSFRHKNIKKLKPIYDEYGGDECEAEYWKARMSKATGELKEIGEDEANEVLYDNIPQNIFDGWFREANSDYKPKLIWLATKNEKVRNACLNRMYESYKWYLDMDAPDGEKKDLSFDEFLVTPIKMYRGGYGQKHTDTDIFSAYTFDKNVAEGFSKEGGAGNANSKVTEATIRPIDTFGSISPNGEYEVMVPKYIAPNGETDGSASSGDKGHVGWKGHKGGSLPKWMRPDASEDDFQSAIKRYKKTKNKALLTMLFDKVEAGSKVYVTAIKGGTKHSLRKGKLSSFEWEDMDAVIEPTSSSLADLVINYGYDVVELEFPKDESIKGIESKNTADLEWNNLLENEKSDIMSKKNEDKRIFIENIKGDYVEKGREEDTEYLNSKINEYYELLKESGDYRQKGHEGQDEGVYEDEYEIASHLEDIGMDEVDAEEVSKCIRNYTLAHYDIYKDLGGDKVLERLYDYINPYGVEHDGNVVGMIYRGVCTDESSYGVLDKCEVGDVFTFGRCSSWSSSRGVAIDFISDEGITDVDKGIVPKMIVCYKNRTSIPIACMSSYPSEEEVLARSDARWMITGIKDGLKEGKAIKTYTVVECGGKNE